MTNTFDKYLIISDMDGTFLSSDAGLIDRNIEAIRYFCENDGVFTLATGRCYRVLDLVFPTATEFVNAPAILCNGGYLYDFSERRVENALTLNKDEIIPLIESLSSEFPSVGFRISCEVGFVCPNKTSYIERRLIPYASVTRYEPWQKYLDIDWHKIVYCAEEDDMKRICAYLKSYKLTETKITTSSPTLLELIPIRSGKGTKISEFRSRYPDRIIIGVGDFDNDIDLLSNVDIAACPDNANQAVKDISSIHLCHHNQGCIADLIYQLDSIKSK